MGKLYTKSLKAVPGFPNIPKQNITRNASGHLQADPARFPGPGSSSSCLAGGQKLAACLKTNNDSSPEACGCKNGNEGMRNLTGYLRSLGFRFGIYTAAGVNACDGAHGTSEGFEQQDADLFFNDWQAEYLMVDTCGTPPLPPPHGPAPGYVGGQGRWEMTKWHDLIAASRPLAPSRSSCHIGCGSSFAGPTLAAKPCNSGHSTPAGTTPGWSELQRQPRGQRRIPLPPPLSPFSPPPSFPGAWCVRACAGYEESKQERCADVPHAEMSGCCADLLCARVLAGCALRLVCARALATVRCATLRRGLRGQITWVAYRGGHILGSLG